MKRLTWLIGILVFSLLLVACAPAAEPAESAVSEPVESPAEETAEEMVEEATIVDIAVEDGRFNTLVAAVTAAGLAETLSGEGEFTVFAPTDDAFAALPEGTVEALLEDPEGALKDILLYHVADALCPRRPLLPWILLTTLQGEAVSPSPLMMARWF